MKVGQQSTHVSGIRMTDEDLAQDRGVSGGKGPLTWCAGSEEGEDVRCSRHGGKHNVSGERPGKRSRREGEHRRLAHGKAPGGTVTEEPD